MGRNSLGSSRSADDLRPRRHLPTNLFCTTHFMISGTSLRRSISCGLEGLEGGGHPSSAPESKKKTENTITAFFLALQGKMRALRPRYESIVTTPDHVYRHIPEHYGSEDTDQLVRSNLAGFHALTGYS